MINKRSIIESLIFDIKLISEPIKGYMRYQEGTMFNFYSNFIDYALTKLFDDRTLNEHIIEGMYKKWGVKEDTLSLLSNFANHLKKFYEKHEESDDFTLLRDNYWEKFPKEAKKCVELLERDLANMKE